MTPSCEPEYTGVTTIDSYPNTLFMAPELPIERIEAIPVDVPHNTGFEISGGGAPTAEHVLIRLHTADGLIGLGEASPKPFFSDETQSSVLGALDILEDALEGVDAAKPAQVHETMDAALRGNPFAKTAIDMACYDALGKALDAPVSTLLGGSVRDRIEVGQSVGIKPTDEAVAEAERYVDEQGFRSIKVKVGSEPESDTERIRAIHEAVGDQVPIRIDANQGYSADIAVPLFAELERDLDILFVEQPVSRDDLKGMRKVTRALETPVLADESVFGPSDSFTVIERNAADIINIKIMKAGGLYRSSQIASTAAAAQYPLAIGSMLELGVGTAAGAHFASTLPHVNYPCDIKGPSLYADQVLREPVRIEDGYTYVPNGPGLGVELDEQKVEEHRSD